MAKNHSKKRPRAITKPIAPLGMRSRKKSRQVTSLFHKLTQQMDQAKAKDPKERDEMTIERIQAQIDEMGGREEYQRASILSTKFHSTSRWVLKILGQMGWTAGIDIEKENTKKRFTKILEVGAINTELLDASKRTMRVKKKLVKSKSKSADQERQSYENVPMYNINVRAIDLRSSHPNIEEMDFLCMDVNHEIENENESGRNIGSYDCIVCSMVLNCVTTHQDRGKMLALLYRQLRPGGLCFLTIPRLCLNQSKFMNRTLFEELLTDALGFEIDDKLKKESPKVAFWVLRRPDTDNGSDDTGKGKGNGNAGNKRKTVEWDEKWEKTKLINRGQKYRNYFAVSLKENEVYSEGRGGTHV